jgi:protein gp37
MSGKTGIEWTDRTWNPVVGCTKVSQGCKLCYAKTIHDMRHAAHLAGKKVAPQYAEPFERVQLMPDRLTWPLSLRQPSRIFVNSVSDLFHENVPDEFIDRVFAVMALASRHTFQVLTKRPERMLEYVNAKFSHRLDPWTTKLASALSDVAIAKKMAWPLTLSWPLPNVWLGVSVENQEAADERIPLLLQTPAAIRFLSCEPLLGPLSLRALGYGRSHRGYLDALSGETEFAEVAGKPHAAPPLPPLDWVIVGGESGSSKQHPRPMHPDWARSLRDQCVAAGVPFLFKQWGDWIDYMQLGSDSWTFTHERDGKRFGVLTFAGASRSRPFETSYAFNDGGSVGPCMVRVGKKRAGRHLDGETWDEYPEVSR